MSSYNNSNHQIIKKNSTLWIHIYQYWGEYISFRKWKKLSNKEIEIPIKYLPHPEYLLGLFVKEIYKYKDEKKSIGQKNIFALYRYICSTLFLEFGLKDENILFQTNLEYLKNNHLFLELFGNNFHQILEIFRKSFKSNRLSQRDPPEIIILWKSCIKQYEDFLRGYIKKNFNFMEISSP